MEWIRFLISEYKQKTVQTHCAQNIVHLFEAYRARIGCGYGKMKRADMLTGRVYAELWIQENAWNQGREKRRSTKYILLL